MDTFFRFFWKFFLGLIFIGIGEKKLRKIPYFYEYIAEPIFMIVVGEFGGIESLFYNIIKLIIITFVILMFFAILGYNPYL